MPERVLVVDDDAQILRALRTSLRAHGYDVVVASDGESALEAAAAQATDVVVLDLGLPDIDGLEVIPRNPSSSINRRSSPLRIRSRRV